MCRCLISLDSNKEMKINLSLKLSEPLLLGCFRTIPWKNIDQKMKITQASGKGMEIINAQINVRDAQKNMHN